MVYYVDGDMSNLSKIARFGSIHFSVKNMYTTFYLIFFVIVITRSFTFFPISEIVACYLNYLKIIYNDIIVYYSGSDVVRGYDFLVNSVWPEVVSNIEARTSSIFAPGNPDIFHAVRTCMI